MGEGGEGQSAIGDKAAVTVAVLSAFAALTKVKDDNVVQAMLQAKSDAVDAWSEYQSKRIKQHLAELGLGQARVLRLSTPAALAPALDSQVRDYAEEIRKYQADEARLQAKARACEAGYDRLNFRDDQFDLSDACLSIALAVLAVAALSRRRWLLWLAWGFGAFGILMGTAGLFRLPLHPTWITDWLS